MLGIGTPQNKTWRSAPPRPRCDSKSPALLGTVSFSFSGVEMGLVLCINYRLAKENGQAHRCIAIDSHHHIYPCLSRSTYLSAALSLNPSNPRCLSLYHAKFCSPSCSQFPFVPPPNLTAPSKTQSPRLQTSRSTHRHSNFPPQPHTPPPPCTTHPSAHPKS